MARRIGAPLALFLLGAMGVCGRNEELPRPANEAQLKALFEPPELLAPPPPPPDPPRCGPDLQIDIRPRSADLAFVFHLADLSPENCPGVISLRVGIETRAVLGIESPPGWVYRTPVAVGGEWTISWHTAHAARAERIHGFRVLTSRLPKVAWWEAELGDGSGGIMGFGEIAGVP